jgi:hypothetical protein
VVFFCPACAAREFGDLRQRWLDPPARYLSMLGPRASAARV